MDKRALTRIGSFITFIILLLVFVIGLGFIVKLTGVDKYFGDFRIEYDGKTITGSDNELVLPANIKSTFYVKGSNSYSVEVQPNADFDYQVGNQSFKFFDEDLSDLICGVFEDCFIVTIPCKVEEYLSVKLRVETVTVPKDIPDYLYKIVVTSSSNGAVIEIAVMGYQFDGTVKIDSDRVYF